MQSAKHPLLRTPTQLGTINALIVLALAGLFLGAGSACQEPVTQPEFSASTRQNLRTLKEAAELIVSFRFEGPDPVFIDGVSLTYHGDYAVYELTTVARDRVLDVLAAEGILDTPTPKEPSPEPDKPYCWISAMSKNGVRYRRTMPAAQTALKLAQALKAAVGDEKAGHSDAPGAMSQFVEQLAARVAQVKGS